MESIRDHLEIFIVTYNRESYLQKTLDMLCESPFAICHITILNNASTDDTLKICNDYKNKFYNLSIITNKINIGANANMLRAIEISNGKYTWILADDDEYDFSNCDDFLEAIFYEKADLIHVGAHTDVPWKFGGELNSPRNLCRKGYPFFRFSSFVPCNVFKTKYFYPYIIQGYKNIVNLYSLMPFFMSFHELNKDIYITKNRIVKAVIGQQRYSIRDFYEGWLNTSLLFRSKNDQILMFRNQFSDDFNTKYNIMKKKLFSVAVLFRLIRLRVSLVKHYNLFGGVLFLGSFILLPLFCFYLILKKSMNKLIKKKLFNKRQMQ